LNLVFVTLLNSSYLLQGLALVDSIVKNYPESKVYVAPLDHFTMQAFANKYQKNKNVLIDGGTIRESYERRLKNHEKVNEVIFSLKPVLIEKALKNIQGDMYIYCDADLFFFSRFELDNIQEDIVLTEHIFRSELAEYIRNGRFNAGFVGFSNSPSSIACLNWWIKKCQESTAHDIENGVLGDQKYLERFSELTSSIRVIKSATMNQSVWMFDKESEIGKGPMIDGKEVNTFHFHRLKPYKFFFKTGINQYGKLKCRKLLYRHIYLPYLRELSSNRSILKGLIFSTPRIKLSDFKRFEWSIK
jgi:hypothetical protein